MFDNNISVYLLSAQKNEGETRKNLQKHLDLTVDPFFPDETRSELQNLNHILQKASKNSDNPVLIVKDTRFLETYNKTIFLETIAKAMRLNFSFLSLDAHLFDENISIDENLIILNYLYNLKAFVLFPNAYNLLLKALNSFSSLHNNLPKLEDIINALLITKLASRKLGLINDGDNKEIVDQALRNKNRVRINIIIPFRNAKMYIGDCCNSIINQSHTNFRVYFIDDCSSDETIKLIPESNQFTVVSNEKRNYALINIHNALINNTFEPDDVIAILDGDDALLHNYALDIVNNIYLREETLISYGQFSLTKDLKPQYVNMYTEKDFINLRDTEWKASHLKTFKFKLYQEFLKQDPNLSSFKNDNEEIYQTTYDIALMLPLLEIAGFKSTYYNRIPIYYYRIHDNNDHITNRGLQYSTELDIRRKKRFKQIF